MRGQPALAAELASAALASSVRRELGHLAARGGAVVAAIDLLELRLDAALPRLEALHGQLALDAASAATVAVLLANTCDERSARGRGRARPERGSRVARRARSQTRSGGGRPRGRRCARYGARAGSRYRGAERAHRTIELASALVIVARLELARGDRGNARAVASRAWARGRGSRPGARTCPCVTRTVGARPRRRRRPLGGRLRARDAAELAMTAGLPVERLVAHAALDADLGATRRSPTLLRRRARQRWRRPRSRVQRASDRPRSHRAALRSG